MKHPIALGLAVCLAVLSAPAPALEGAATVDEVLAMMDRAPAVERGTAPHRWSRMGDAKRIAVAIVKTARSSADVGDLVVYDLYESGNRASAVAVHPPDAGHSYGAWQINEAQAPKEVTLDPMKAAPLWLGIAARSRTACAHLPPDEQLAAVASGNCDHGRQLAGRRAKLARVVLGLEPLDGPKG
jgi:hypothetical protein